MLLSWLHSMLCSKCSAFLWWNSIMQFSWLILVPVHKTSFNVNEAGVKTFTVLCLVDEHCPCHLKVKCRQIKKMLVVQSTNLSYWCIHGNCLRQINRKWYLSSIIDINRVLCNVLFCLTICCGLCLKRLNPLQVWLGLNSLSASNPVCLCQLACYQSLSCKLTVWVNPYILYMLELLIASCAPLKAHVKEI